jgi:hypothetical protein
VAGLACLGAMDLINPGGTDFARLVGGVPPGQMWWTVGYVVGGLLMAYGFLRTDRVAETAGLVALTVCQLVQLAVAVRLLGFQQFTLTRIAVLVIVSICASARVSALWSRHGLTITIPARKRR